MANFTLEKALFFDIETHRGKNWDQISKALQKAFIGHYYDPQSYETPEDHYSEIAGLYAEFSQCICAVFGYENPATGQFQTLPIYGPNESEVLTKSAQVINTFSSNGYWLAGHNINACDSSYLVKRYILNKMKVPKSLMDFENKPWERDNLDTMEFWKFGDYKRVSLETICAAMGIDCKTDDIGGDNLYQYDLDEMPWDQLVHYCTEDVVSNYKMMKEILNYI